MNVSKRTIPPILTLLLLAWGLGACKEGNTAGENLDRALDKTGEAVKDVGEAIQPDK